MRNARDAGDMGPIPGSGRSPGGLLTVPEEQRVTHKWVTEHTHKRITQNIKYDQYTRSLNEQVKIFHLGSHALGLTTLGFYYVAPSFLHSCQVWPQVMRDWKFLGINLVLEEQV